MSARNKVLAAIMASAVAACEPNSAMDAHERGVRIQAAADAIENGVYFGLPAEVYHSVPRLSASGIQRLCVSPATFWHGSWLDPDLPEPEDEEETKAQQLGKAYHVARLEPDRFHDAYCRLPDKAEHGEKLITSDTGMKAELKAMGLQQSIGDETLVERAQRLLAAGCDKPLWHLIMDEHEQQRAGRIAIAAKYFDQIVQDMERLQANSEVHKLLAGGQSEVSIFWTDQHGIPMKARLDYLRPDLWNDLKTFDNSRQVVLAQALADRVRFGRLYVQAVVYRDAVEAVRRGDVDIVGEATPAQQSLIGAIQLRPDELQCWFTFQEKGGVPNILAREFRFFDVPDSVTHSWDTGASEEAKAAGHEATRTRTGLHIRGSWDVEQAKRTFVLYSEAYKPGTPWFPLESTGAFSDLDFNSYWIEGKA